MKTRKEDPVEKHGIHEEEAYERLDKAMQEAPTLVLTLKGREVEMIMGPVMSHMSREEQNRILLQFGEALFLAAGRRRVREDEQTVTYQ